MAGEKWLNGRAAGYIAPDLGSPAKLATHRPRGSRSPRGGRCACRCGPVAALINGADPGATPSAVST